MLRSRHGLYRRSRIPLYRKDRSYALRLGVGEASPAENIIASYCLWSVDGLPVRYLWWEELPLMLWTGKEISQDTEPRNVSRLCINYSNWKQMYRYQIFNTLESLSQYKFEL